MTREQKRAADAAKLVQRAEERLSPAEVSRFNTLAHAIPVWIRTNGLLQTVVFLEAKAGGKEGAEKTLEEVLVAQLRAAKFPAREASLSTALSEMPYEQYCRWQEEAVHCAVWIKRFAAALLGEAQR